MRSLERNVALLPWCWCPSVCPSVWNGRALWSCGGL